MRTLLLAASSRAALGALLLGAAPALACSVCGQGKEGTGAALLTMTLIMSALPLSMVGGVVGWAVYRVRKARREEAALACAARPSTGR